MQMHAQLQVSSLDFLEHGGYSINLFKGHSRSKRRFVPGMTPVHLRVGMIRRRSILSSLIRGIAIAWH